MSACARVCRSPYPTFHLLLEDEISAAVAAYPDTDKVWRRNQDTVRGVGVEGMQALLQRCKE